MSNTKAAPSPVTTLVGSVMDRYMVDDIMKQFTFDELSSQIENASKEGNLSPSETNDRWKQFYVVRFGDESTNLLVEKMQKDDVPINWKQIYNEKSNEEGPSNPKADEKKSKKGQKLAKLRRGFKKSVKVLKELAGHIIRVVVGTIAMFVFTTVAGVVIIMIEISSLMLSACLCCFCGIYHRFEIFE